MQTNDRSNFYPYDQEYEFLTELTRLNLDEECQKDIDTNSGFIISEPKGIKKSIKDPDGIFSTRFGQTLQDINPFADRYKCKCGETMGRIYRGSTCPHCNNEVIFIDDNFNYFGWIKLKPEYHLIHPNLYKSLEFLFGTSKTGGTKLDNIIKPIDEKDQDGHGIDIERPKEEPFLGIGMFEFKERFDEILDFYFTTNKADYYHDLKKNKDKVFIHSVPVFTTQLRPFRLEEETFNYGDVNEIYTMLAKLAHVINTDNLKIFRKNKPKKQLLYDMQIEYNKLYSEIELILSGKKGRIRTLFGGSCNFTARNVIIPNPQLRIDQVTLSYYSLAELLQQVIINILCKSYNMSYNDAYKIWYRSSIEKDDRVYNIIQGIISTTERGIPIIINRNPTMS